MNDRFMTTEEFLETILPIFDEDGVRYSDYEESDMI